MSKGELLHRRKGTRKERKSGFKEPRANSYLIITEGECTEPYYFQGLADKIRGSIGGNVDISAVPLIDVDGKGCSTTRLVEEAEKKVKEAKILYQNVWVVFDKDEFIDFDDAIKLCKKKGYKAAWSNQCFEYWIYLHFEYSDSAIHRKEWKDKLDVLFAKNKLGNTNGYEKNIEDIYNLLNRDNRVEKAIKNAERRMQLFNSTSDLPSKYDPGTTVHKLVKELMGYMR